MYGYTVAITNHVSEVCNQTKRERWMLSRPVPRVPQRLVFFYDVSHKSKNQTYHQNMRNIGIFRKNFPKTRTS